MSSTKRPEDGGDLTESAEIGIAADGATVKAAGRGAHDLTSRIIALLPMGILSVLVGWNVLNEGWRWIAGAVLALGVAVTAVFWLLLVVRRNRSL